jgi:hypothetical protein
MSAVGRLQAAIVVVSTALNLNVAAVLDAERSTSPGPAPSAATTTDSPAAPARPGKVVARWNFDEAAGATTAADATGNGHTATLDERYRAVRFGTYDPAVRSKVVWMSYGLLRTPSTDELVAGDRPIEITVEVRTTWTQGFSNIFQKGTWHTDKGFWKIEMSRGTAHCRFAGSRGSAGVEAGPKINDGRWHTVTCKKTRSAIELIVDGHPAQEERVTVGSITNTEDVAIGGKYLKNGRVPSASDMLHGYLNWASVTIG